MAHEPKAGDTFTHERTCDRYRPLYYAGASGDFNPLHVDADAGKKAGFGGPILQGLCTLAWAAEAAVRLYGEPTRLKKLKVRFSRPVKPGDQLIFELDLLQVRGMMCKMKGVAKVDGNLVCEAEMGAVVRDK